MDQNDEVEQKRGWFGRKAKKKAEDLAQKQGTFGGLRNRHEQLEAIERQATGK
jgi:hypothetical protein